LHPDVLRIVVTAHADLESIMDAVNRAGIYRFYTKPWNDRELRNNIRDAFRHYWALHDSLIEQRGIDVLEAIAVDQSA
jgi:response regulator RpfG family c-di-GMP phosphodiesterase